MYRYIYMMLNEDRHLMLYQAGVKYLRDIQGRKTRKTLYHTEPLVQFINMKY